MYPEQIDGNVCASPGLAQRGTKAKPDEFSQKLQLPDQHRARLKVSFASADGDFVSELRFRWNITPGTST
jgi:hypothetical protein